LRELTRRATDRNKPTPAGDKSHCRRR
jgi:hypothetical protein